MKFASLLIKGQKKKKKDKIFFLEKPAHIWGPKLIHE